jgi:hypothetical protein
MACSKLFSGDLPELINDIMQYFHHDYKTLHSCILVNKLWCHLAIPLLWEDPFSIKFPKNHRFIEIYLHHLNEDDKTKLYNYLIHGLFSSNTLFNYPSFIQHLDMHKVCNSIKRWIAAIEISSTKESYLSYSQLSNFTQLIYKSLFRLFIENRVNLHSFEVNLLSDTEFECFDEIFELILQNPNFIYNIKNFKFDIFGEKDNIKKLLAFIHSNCNSISSIYFLFPTFHNNYLIMEKCLSQIINSQENLEKILFGFNAYYPLYNSLLSLKNPSCSNTLNTIIFYYINFENINILNEVFNQLNVLKSIHIIYCYSLDIFFQQINGITISFKLKSLFLHKRLQIELLEPLIQKSGNFLENFGITNDELDEKPQQLLQLIMKYCNKIKYLGPIWLDNQNIYLLLNLIENITNNLNYLIIDDDFPGHFNSIILQNLGQILPLNLEYLNLSLTINLDDLKVFLKNSSNTFIKKLLINNKMKLGNEDIWSYIEEYIVKKKRVKYLAI